MNNGISCPVCSDNKAALYTEKNGYKIYRCQTCSLLFIWPRIVEASRELYDKEYFQGARHGYGYVDYEKDKVPMEKVFIRYLTEIERYVPERGKLFDVGTATGFFLRIAARRGWEVAGSDISPYAAAHGRANGLNIVTGTLENHVWPTNAFDVITMWDVFEHFSDPERSLSIIKTMLKEKGIIALNTPDSGGIGARLLRTKWYLIIPPEHTFLFNRANLTMMLEKSGFHVIYHRHIGKRYSLAYSASILHGWLKIPAAFTSARLLNNRFFRTMTLPINLCDNIFVVAKKR